MKKLVHKILFVILFFSMVVSACAPTATPTPTAVPTAAPADPYGKYDKPLTLMTVRTYETTEKLPAGDSPENNQYTRYVKDTLNIDTKYVWTAASADFDAKVNLAIASNDIPDAIRDMNARLGLAPGLAALGVQRASFEKIIDGAMADHCHKTNPRLATRDDYRAMLEASM